MKNPSKRRKFYIKTGSYGARKKIITSMITIGQNIFYQEFVANRS